MKKITLIIGLLSISFGFTQELITDGGFEDENISGAWYNTGAALSFPNNGTAYSGAIRANLGNEFGTIRQDISPTLGIEYTVTFWWRFNRGDSTTPGYVTIKDNSDNSNVGGPETLTEGTDTWTKTTLIFTSSTATNLRFQVFKDNRNSVVPESTNNAMWFDEVSIVPTSSLSVKGLEQFSFGTYPNPAKEKLYLSAEENIGKIEIYSILGQQVMNKAINSDHAEINIADLSNGIYIVKAFIEDAIGSYKFIKQ
ncbi:T9SS type A sorting domain-containing protein [Aestuariivivens sediminis]|uniref:T9SS type A sorting domain-containing protein n=1 Tax=Aestuariivivens sediminis TaxID=2913557 RepID=UPI001F599ACF|nr:T9SS type A sorting domain-containing protein [Aestuariivivens sediminis]